MEQIKGKKLLMGAFLVALGSSQTISLTSIDSVGGLIQPSLSASISDIASI